MSTIKDVARLAGVSVATVSCHLSGAKPVKQETRMKIERAIRELKYVPNAAARQLKKANMKAVGVILPDFNEHLYTEIFRGIVKHFQSHKTLVNVAFSHFNTRLEQQAFFNFAHQNVMGMIVISCQPQNHDFFVEWQLNYHIPVIFCMHKSSGIVSGFVGFDDYSVSRSISSALLEHGVKRQIVLSRDDRFSNEADFLRGVQDAHCDAGESFSKSQRYIINGTKENAFKAATEFTHVSSLPEAVLCTSGEITKGVLEAFSALKLKVPEDILVITLSEESWNKSEHFPGVIYTTRDAANLGITAGKMLQNYVDDPEGHPLHEELLSDRFLKKGLVLPPREKAAVPAVHPSGPTLRFLSFLGTHTGSQIAFENILRIYEAETGVHISTHIEKYNCVYSKEFLDWMIQDVRYDFLLMDLPWKETFIKIGAISKLDDLVYREDFPRERLLDCDFESFFYKGHCYGIPVVNGAQTLFYRRDLFEDSANKAAYYKKYNTTLRPPRTWQEYNRVARFFTRSCNPSSPTEWGVSEMDVDVGSLVAPNYNRFVTAGGRLLNSEGELQLNTPQNRIAFETVLEPFYYEMQSQECSKVSAIENFCLGRTAMCISFNDGATGILDAITTNQIGQLGYALPPGGHNIRAGWALTIHPRSPLREEIFKFLKWFMRTDICYYYTILSGNTANKLPYLNGEILNLYPWMELYANSGCTYSKRIPSLHSNSGVQISNLQLEQEFCRIIHKMLRGSSSIEEILAEAQHRLTGE